MNKEIPPFYIGQEVICIETGSQRRTIKGEKYTVLFMWQCKKCGKWYVGHTPVAEHSGVMKATCECGNSDICRDGFWKAPASRFRAYIPPMEAITFEKITEQNPVSVN